jgi:protoheme IX farnesyltransferase
MMALLTTVVGFFLPPQAVKSWEILMVLLFATLTTFSGSALLNNVLERHWDGLMERTRHRATATGIIAPARAFAVGVCLCLVGVGTLASVTLPAAFVMLLASFLYVVVYTPLKRVTWWNTTVGAIPGALPPLVGWVAATGKLEWAALVPVVLLFAWQHPHFFAIAWMYREEYENAGFRMLPVVKPKARTTFFMSIAFTLLLLYVSLVPFWTGHAGFVYFLGAFVFGSLMLLACFEFLRTREHGHARQLMRATLIYIPAIIFFLVLDLWVRA